MGEIIWVTVLVLCCLLGVALTALHLPGTWLIVGMALIYGWSGEWTRLSWKYAGILVGLAIVGEAVELLSSYVTSRRAGASRRAAWGGLIGGVVGMCVLSVPIPLIGSVVGALLGCFGGAMIAELSVRKQLGAGAKVGLFSAVGFAIGTVAKLAVALVMAGILLTKAVLFAAGPADADSTADGPNARTARLRIEFVDDAHLARGTGGGSLVGDLQDFDYATVVDEAKRRRGPMFAVNEAFDDSVPEGAAVIADGFQRVDHLAFVGVPIRLHDGRAGV